MQKNNNRFKKLKLKKEKRNKENNSPELQKPNMEAEVYNNNKQGDWEKKKNLRSLVIFHSANKIDNYNRGGENPRESTGQVKT